MSPAQYILALDQGTTSSRAIVFDQSGQIVHIEQQEFAQIYPQAGWVEHNPMDLWHSQSSVALKAMSAVHLSATDIAAIGITNQRETTIVWDKVTGEPIYNAIVWQDRRTARFCEALSAAGHDAVFKDKTGLRIDAYFSGTKIKWILDNVEGARDLANDGRLAFGTVDSWLVWQLTQGALHITDASNASRTLLFNIHTQDWDDELLELLDVPRSMLPTVCDSSAVYGHTSALFDAPIPIAGIAGDQQAALFGQLCTSTGMVKNTYGTGCFMMMNTGDVAVPSKNNLLTTVAWRINGKVEYALEGSIFIAGAVVQWLRDELQLIESSSDIEALAQSVSDSGGVVLVPAFAGLGAPHWNPHARGAVFGMTRGSNRAHLARAALEAIAFQTVDVLNAMQMDAGVTLTELRVDGGATGNDLLMQFQADLLNVAVIRPVVTETTALGAAYLAGLAVGFWTSTDALANQWQPQKCFTRQMPEDAVAAKMHNWHRAINAVQVWAQG